MYQYDIYFHEFTVQIWVFVCTCDVYSLCCEWYILLLYPTLLFILIFIILIYLFVVGLFVGGLFVIDLVVGLIYGTDKLVMLLLEQMMLPVCSWADVVGVIGVDIFGVGRFGVGIFRAG